MPDQPMTPRLERLHLAAVLSGWQPDWDRYHQAVESERQARLASLSADLKASGWSARSGDPGTVLSGEERDELIYDYGTDGV